jgi:hypothetical protein
MSQEVCESLGVPFAKSGMLKQIKQNFQLILLLGDKFGKLFH